MNNEIYIPSVGRARLGVFPATIARKITQLSPSLTPTLVMYDIETVDNTEPFWILPTKKPAVDLLQLFGQSIENLNNYKFPNH